MQAGCQGPRSLVAHCDSARPAVSTGLVLVGAAVLLAWLAGITGTAWRSVPTAYRRTWPEFGAAVGRLADDPLGILRLGLAVQLCGFVLFVAVR
jgi:hypothetical protein